MKFHTLKLNAKYRDDVFVGKKKAELRKNDRDNKFVIIPLDDAYIWKELVYVKPEINRAVPFSISEVKHLWNPINDIRCW